MAVLWAMGAYASWRPHRGQGSETMTDQERKTIALKDHLAAQAAQSEVFLATVEGVPDGRVKVTPWSATGGCLCALSFVVDEAAIKELTVSGDIHVCCGKQLSVVE